MTNSFSSLMNLPANNITEVVEQKKVPNLKPFIKNQPYRIAIIGEAPGEDEAIQGEPFVGTSGRFLNMWLSRAGLVRSACFIGNICQVRPPKNDITLFSRDGIEFREGLEQLQKELTEFNPNLVFLLGKTALWAAKGTSDISSWRGSLFISDRAPFAGRKCLASFHPANCLRQYENTPLLVFDLLKAKAEAEFPELVLPHRELDVNLNFEQTCERLDQIIDTKCKIATDIEGGVSNVSCISFATSPSKAFIVPFTYPSGASFWQLDQEAVLWQKVARILGDVTITKIFQNGLYDRFVLQFAHNLVVRGAREDTMLKFWEVYCELEKSLGFQCSILTREPYYKFERKADDAETFYRYCCKDSAVTFEIEEQLEKFLKPGQREHYHRNILALNAFLYMELRGINYNEEEAKKRLELIRSRIYLEQAKLDAIAASHKALANIDWTKSKKEILAYVQDLCCYKKDKNRPKKKAEDDGYWTVHFILSSNSDAPLTDEEKGQIATLCGASMNTKSDKFKTFLYDTLQLPVQLKKDVKTKELRPTTDYEALLKLSKSHPHPALICGLELSRLRTRAQYLSVHSYKGRMHCSYNLVGSETGRVTSSRSMIYANDKSRVGLNMQTISDDWDLGDADHPLSHGLRDLYQADPGCYIGKMDLKGADGWTIGAYLKALGNPTMLDDLLFGLKPAQIVAYTLKHSPEDIKGKSREELKLMLKTIKKEDWEYFVSKQGIWGTCYTMGPRKLSEIIFLQSEGEVNLSEKDVRVFQSNIFSRYDIKLLHEYFYRTLTKQPYPPVLEASNGLVRKFWNRPKEALGEALAHLPQVYTTHATLLAAIRLWTDPENRVPLNPENPNGPCKLRIEPLHQVHDELVTQWKQEDTTWAANKLKSYFNNEIQIAGTTLVIPYDGAYGVNWSMNSEAKRGDL